MWNLRHWVELSVPPWDTFRVRVGVRVGVRERSLRFYVPRGFGWLSNEAFVPTRTQFLLVLNEMVLVLVLVLDLPESIRSSVSRNVEPASLG